MGDIVPILFPVFALIGLGYIAARTGLVPESGINGILAFATQFAAPCLLMRAVLQAQFAETFDLALIASFYLPIVFFFAAMTLTSRFLWRREAGDSVVIGFASTFGNTVMLGVPVVIGTFGDIALTPMVGIVGLHAVAMYLMGVTLMEVVRQEGAGVLATLRRMLVGIASNALLIGVALGVIGNVAGITPLPAPIETATRLLGESAIPLGLFGVGAALTRYRLRAEATLASVASASKLLLQPGATYILARWVFELDPLPLGVATLTAAMPLGMNSYLFAAMYNRAVGTAASGIVLSTLLSALSVSFWLVVLTWNPA